MYLLVGIAIVALVYLACMALGLGLLISPLVGALVFGYWRMIEPEERSPRGGRQVLLTSGVGTALGFLIGTPMKLKNEESVLTDGVGVLIATIVGWAVYSWRAQSHTVACVLCEQSADGSNGFDCPRCGDHVCSRTTCWNSKYFRCVRCHEREVVAFPIAEAWWVARLGRRVTKGECLSCYKDADESDLRECGQCHWPMCRRCWDYYNGTCQRCEWLMPDLPPRLAPFMKSRKSRQAPRAARRPHRQGDAPMPPRPPNR